MISSGLTTRPPSNDGPNTLIGLLNCNKPPGMTSRDLVNIVQRRLRKTKVGHAGTLDPLAEGVLVLGVGSAARLVPYVQQQPKHYRATFRLGVSTVTGDLEGELCVDDGLAVPTRQEIDAAIPNLVGSIEQVPPAHSAIWIDGQRAHRRIRAGEVFEMPSRVVRVDSLELLRYEYPEIELDIVCGSGTYIRTLGMDLARLVSTTAVMTHLHRTAVGIFQCTDAHTIDEIREGGLEPMLLAPLTAVPHLPTLTVDPKQSQRLGHGLCIDGTPKRPEYSPHPKFVPDPQQAAAICESGELRAILRRKQNQWCPYRVFPVTKSAMTMPEKLAAGLAAEQKAESRP